MAISPVSSVSFNNYNNVTFAGRKNKEHHTGASNPVSHKLAVPTAALMLAMMPSNAVSAPEWENENRIEYIQERDIDNLDDAATYRIEPQENKRKVLQKTTILEASPKYGNCIMELVTDDGGKTGNLILTFEENTKYNGFINDNGERKKIPLMRTTLHSVEVDTLKTINNRLRSYDPDSEFPVRYVSGKAKIVNIVRRDDGTNIVEKMNSHDYPNRKYEITKEFYNDLKKFLGDLVPYTTENKY